MGGPGVRQLQFLSQVFGDVGGELRPEGRAVLGCSTGNGFHHIDAAVTQRVVGVDINPRYLAVVAARFRHRLPGLELVCADVLQLDFAGGSFDLVHCALIFEYVDPEALVQRAAGWLRTGGALTAVIQLP